jgi:GntR family transcriptional regulator
LVGATGAGQETCQHAEALGVTPGTAVLVRDRVMSADGVVVQLATSRLPRDVTQGTPIEDDNPGPGGIYARLEEAGVKLDHFRESVATRMPTRDENSRLQLPPVSRRRPRG